MQHCLAQYVSLAISGLCRLYSVRKDGDRIATLELRASDSSGQPHIHQLKGPRNIIPDQEVLDATVTWLIQHQDSIARRLSSPGERHSNVAFDRIVWRPYATALAADATVGKPPTRPAVGRILMQMRDLWSLEN